MKRYLLLLCSMCLCVHFLFAGEENLFAHPTVYDIPVFYIYNFESSTVIEMDDISVPMLNRDNVKKSYIDKRQCIAIGIPEGAHTLKFYNLHNKLYKTLQVNVAKNWQYHYNISQNAYVSWDTMIKWADRYYHQDTINSWLHAPYKYYKSPKEIEPVTSKEDAKVYIGIPSPRKSYYGFKNYYEIDGVLVASTQIKEYFEVVLPVGEHNICAYMNPIAVNSDNSIDSLTKYYNSFEEIKQKSIYPPDCQNIQVVPGVNCFKYTGDMHALTQAEFQKFLNNGRIVRKIDAIVPSLMPNESTVDTDIPYTQSKNENTYVLIIANENYENHSSVTYANNDGQIFKQYCMQTLGVPEKQIRYISNATYGKMVGAVDWLEYALNNFSGAKAIVYYCGHGIPDERTNQAYLIPVDGKASNTTTCYSLNKLYKTLAETKAESITYFMDACFTGANRDGGMLVAARGVAIKPKNETLSGKSIVFSASSGDETAMALESEGHGLFTYFLLKKLQETKGNVTYGELADYINKNVKKEAFLINEKPQTPVVATSPAIETTWKTMKLK